MPPPKNLPGSFLAVFEQTPTGLQVRPKTPSMPIGAVFPLSREAQLRHGRLVSRMSITKIPLTEVAGKTATKLFHAHRVRFFDYRGDTLGDANIVPDFRLQFDDKISATRLIAVPATGTAWVGMDALENTPVTRHHVDLCRSGACCPWSTDVTDVLTAAIKM